MSTTHTDPRPRLTGIMSDSGECERCHREIGRVFEVRHPDGTTATYGRRCCVKVTGYTRLDVELRIARRGLIIGSRRAKITAEFPELAELIGVHSPGATDVNVIIADDRLWHGEDEQGHDRGYSRSGDWRTALRDL